MMMRSVNKTDQLAGRYYYASKDRAACQSWKRVGAIPADYPCTKEEERQLAKAQSTKVSTRNAPVTSPRPKARPTGLTQCEKRDGKVHIGYKHNADKAAAKAICLASLGY